jgi:hypothetical protein
MRTFPTILVAALLGCWNSHAQHGHLNVGARGVNHNDQLYFENGPDFIDSSGYVKTLAFTNAGRFAGYYEGNITLTVLAATEEHGGPFPNAPALGSFIQFTIKCYAGPDGGSFGFWDAGSTSPSDSVLPGQESTNLFRLTESDGSSGSDPYGHVHGRRFTATKPGVYKIGFKAWDTSSNGPTDGPIHLPSDFLPVYFQAGVNVTHIAKTGLVTTVQYGAQAGQLFTLEYTTNLADPNLWLPAAGLKVGDDYFQTLEDPASVDSQRFYRIRVDPLIE